jgi:hypothetical protein
MITVYIEPNTIAPFVDNITDSANLINFEVRSSYYIPNDNILNNDIFNNEYYDIYETKDFRDKKALQITTRIVQIKPELEDNISYGFALKLSPEINEIKHPTSKFFTNFREQENFNSFIDNYKNSPVFDWEERRFTNPVDIVYSIDNQIILDTTEWDDVYKKNYTMIKSNFEKEWFQKKTSIQYLPDASVRGLNDDFKMMYPYRQGPFNEVFNGYCLPVIYNEKHGYWENTSTLKILNNYWEKILLNLEDQERYSFISKLLYPIITNNDIHNFYFGAHLEPFEIRDILEYRVRVKNALKGIKCSFVEAGINSRGNVNTISDIITAANNLNSYHDGSENFSDTDISTINLQTTSYEKQRKSLETNTIFDRNGNITKDSQFVITTLAEPYPLWTKTINFNFLNVDEHIDPIRPFNDSNKAEIYVSNLNFYDEITTIEEVKNNILQTLSNNFFNRKGIIDNNAQYTPNGYDVNKSTNPTGRDSKIYIGFKE